MVAFNYTYTSFIPQIKEFTKLYFTYITCGQGYVIVVTYVRMIPEGDCEHIRQYTSTCIATNMFPFRYSKKLPELAVDHSSNLYTNESHCDYGILTLTFLWCLFI